MSGIHKQNQPPNNSNLRLQRKESQDKLSGNKDVPRSNSSVRLLQFSLVNSQFQIQREQREKSQIPEIQKKMGFEEEIQRSSRQTLFQKIPFEQTEQRMFSQTLENLEDSEVVKLRTFNEQLKQQIDYIQTEANTTINHLKQEQKKEKQNYLIMFEIYERSLENKKNHHTVQFTQMSDMYEQLLEKVNKENAQLKQTLKQYEGLQGEKVKYQRNLINC